MVLNYSVNYYFSSLQLRCYTKIPDKIDGMKLINNLITLILPASLIQNPYFSKETLIGYLVNRFCTTYDR